MATDVAYKVEARPPPRPPVPIPRGVEYTGKLMARVDSTSELAPGLAEYREAFERRVIAIAETSLGVAELELPLQVTLNDTGALQIAGTGYHLDLNIDSDKQAAEISWSLYPGGADARSRLAVLNLVRVLHGAGPLVLRDPEFGVLQLLRLQAVEPPTEIDDELAFYRSLVLIEEWSGYRFRLPTQIPDREARLVWETAWIVHDRALSVVFLSDVQATISDPTNWRTAGELHFSEQYTEPIFGTEALLGLLDYRVPVQPVSAEPVDAGGLRVTFHPTSEPLTVRLAPARPDSEERADLVEAGEIPVLPRIEPDPDRQDRARQLLNELRTEVPADPDLRKRLRREWPTR